MALHDRDTAEVPHLAQVETQRIRRPVVETSELPPIPTEILTGEVEKQAALVIDECAQEADSEKETISEDELKLRIKNQLNKVMEFLDMIYERYRKSNLSLPELFRNFVNTIESNIKLLENPEAGNKTIVINLGKIVLPILTQLHMQFENDQHENFQFAEVKKELKKSIGRLAKMIQASETNA